MKRFFSLVVHELGFDNLSHFSKWALGFKTYGLIFVQAGGSALSVALTFTEKWVWSPAFGLFVVLGLIVLKNITCTIVAIRVKKERFDLRKFYSIVPEAVAVQTLLTFSFHIANFSLILSWLPAVVFGWFAMFNFIMLARNFVLLGVIPTGFSTYLMKKLNIEDKELLDSIENGET